MKQVRLILACLCVCCTAVLSAQTRHMVVYRTDGTRVSMDIATIDSIRIEEPPYGGREYVDLGLSVLWAACNVGAGHPGESGAYYAWGETEPKDDYSEDRYLYYVYEQYQSIGADICGTKYDAASAVWGEGWRMPTLAEAEELGNQCSWTWTTQDGVNGYRVTGPSGASIFLPAAGYYSETEQLGAGQAGYYWTGTQSAALRSAAHNLNFTGYTGRWTASRAYGFPVRAVHSR
ncbi:MAG: hypothetical protein K2N13_00020 [Paraprevotella sp.]|nr:hypothetical protein [Paraprevotella sp.]